MMIKRNYLWLILLMTACNGENTLIIRQETGQCKNRINGCDVDLSTEDHPVLFRTVIGNGTCVINQVDIKTHCYDPICIVADKRIISSRIQSTFDPCSGYVFIADLSTRELWMTMMPGECPLFFCGKLTSSQKCACFLNGDYYYVNDCNNTLNAVRFSSQWMIAGEKILDTLPDGFIPDNMTLSPALDYLYVSGEYIKPGNELISWSLADSSFHATSVILEKTDKIAFGSDNILYAVSPSPPYHLTPLSP